MNKSIITTVYDEVLHKLETITFDNIDKELLNHKMLKATTTFKDSKNGELKITITNDKSMVEAFETLSQPLLTDKQRILFLRLVIQKYLFFTAQDIIIYRILLSHYINNQVNGLADISLDTIHKEYRNKAFIYENGKKKYDDDTLRVYKNSLIKLCRIKVIINFRNSNLKVAKHYNSNEKYSISSQLLQISNNATRDNIDTVNFKYTLGKIGDYFINAKQYGQLLPKEIYSLRFNQIDTFNIAIYIIRMVVINKRWKKDINIYVSTLLSRIMKYNIKGYNTNSTYLQYLRELKAVKRNKQIKYIEKQLNYLLEMFKEKDIITDYKYTGKFQYKYIRDGELLVTILTGKKSKTK